MTTGSPTKYLFPIEIREGMPSRADATYDFKYGPRSVHGGGRSSARETIGMVVAGALAKKTLKIYSGTEILAYVSQAHKVVFPEELVDHENLTLDQIEGNIVRCPNPEYAEKMIVAIDVVRVRGDSVGGCWKGLGSPVFGKLEIELAEDVMSNQQQRASSLEMDLQKHL